MKLARRALLAFVLLVPASLASADVEFPLMDIFGNDSGWSVFLPDDVNYGIVVDRITSDYARVEIAKNLTEGPTSGQFPAATIRFHQRLADADTVGTIQIDDEVVYNCTGVDWTDYHWAILGAAAAFDRAATDASGFDVSPFANKSWGPPDCTCDPDHVRALDVDGGVVPAGTAFTPGLNGGKLYIDVDLAPGNSDFKLVQYPTPEPGVLVLAGLGFAGLLPRRRAR